MVVKANIVETKEINVNLNQGAGGINAPVKSVNDKTGHVVLDATDVGALPDTTFIPSKVSELENDNGYLTGFSETDPTVPAWAKEPQKPSYTFAEVGADPEGSAVSTVSDHNTNQYSHQDIRLLIDGLNSRLNALADSDDVTLDQMSELVAYIKDNRELIEGVTTNKVNVSDIINNLTTNVADKPLAAAMGVELLKEIENIEVPVNLSELKEDSKHRVVSDAEKARWNSKSEFSGSYKDLFDQPFGETWLSKGSDTLASDNIIYGGYHKVSNTVPSLGDIEKGYAIKYYRVSDGVITGDPVTLTNSNADMSVHSAENGVLIRYDGLPFVIVSFTGIGTWSALNFSDITSPGVYFLQDTNFCIESIQLTDYDGFPLKVLQGGVVKTVNHIVPDENGNVNVEGESGSIDAFDMVSSNTVTWNGDAEGKVLVNNSIDPSMYYVRVSSVIPTMEQLQKGGTWASVGTDGVEYEEPFTSEDISETSNLIDCFGGAILIAKEDNVRFFTDYADATLPKAGVYFVGFTDGGYASKLTITDFTQFTKPILKKESLPVQHKDWYSVVVNNGNTAVGDAIVHGGFVKVSNSVPTEAELQSGGTIRYYNVENGEITGDLITANYLESPYSILARAEGILIAYDGVPIVVISINGSPNIGPFVYDVITSPGVYFNQGSHTCVHSLTIDGYTGFEANYSKIPMEFIPDGIGGASSWNDLPDKPFEETAVTLVDNQTVTLTSAGEGELIGGFTIEENGVYTVIYNGIEYADLVASAAIDADDRVFYCIGNVEALDGNDNGIPFILLSIGGATKVVDIAYGESCTITITGSEIKHLDNKFLKPFEIITVGKDTLTWDGKPSEYYTEGSAGTYYFVSSATPTMEDFANGATMSSLIDGMIETKSLTSDDVYDQESVIILAAGSVAIVLDETKPTNWGSFEKKGVYFLKIDSSYVISLTINGYTGFTEEQTKLKPECIPTDAINEMILAMLIEKGLITE